MGSFDSHLLCCPIQIVVGKKVAVLRDKNIHIWLKCYQRFITWVVWWCFCHSCHSCDAFVTVVTVVMLLSQLWCFCHSCHSCDDAFVTVVMLCHSRHSCDAYVTVVVVMLLSLLWCGQAQFEAADHGSNNRITGEPRICWLPAILYFLFDYNGCCFSQCNVWS